MDTLLVPAPEGAAVHLASRLAGSCESGGSEVAGGMGRPGYGERPTLAERGVATPAAEAAHRAQPGHPVVVGRREMWGQDLPGDGAIGRRPPGSGSTVPRPGVDATNPGRHVYVLDPHGRDEPSPGLLVAWRRTPEGWDGWVTYAHLAPAGRWVLLREWVPASLLQLVRWD